MEAQTKHRNLARRLFDVLPALVFAIVIAATQVGPDEAQKRLDAWTGLLGSTWPQWLNARLLILLVGAPVAVFYLILGRRALRKLPARFRGGVRGFMLHLPQQATEALPAVPSVQDVVALEAVRTFFRNDALKAATSIHELLSELRRNHLKGVTFAPLLDKELARFLETRRVLEAGLADDSVLPLQQVHRSLVAFLREYHGVVTLTHECEKEKVRLMEPPFADTYREWESLHERLLGKIDDLVAQAGSVSIRASVGEIGLAPVENHRYSVLYSKSVKMLEAATADQRGFLRLFCVDELPMRSGRPDTYLSHRVYQAGIDLAKRGFLLQTGAGTLEDEETFCLSDATSHAWTVQGPSPFPRKKCIGIDWGIVCAQLASGSGT